MLYVYLDESGDLGFSERSSKCIVIGILLTENPATVRRCVRKTRDTIKNSKRRPSELHFNASDQTIRKRLLRRLNKECDFSTYFVILNKSKVHYDLQGAKDKLYHYLCKIVLSKPKFQSSKQVTIVVDNRCKKQFIREDMSTYILNETFSIDIKAKLIHQSSEKEKCLQAIDFMAGAVFHKHERADTQYCEIFESKIIEEVPLFGKVNGNQA